MPPPETSIENPVDIRERGGLLLLVKVDGVRKAAPKRRG